MWPFGTFLRCCVYILGVSKKRKVCSVFVVGPFMNLHLLSLCDWESTKAWVEVGGCTRAYHTASIQCLADFF